MSTRRRNPRVEMRELMMEAKGWLHSMTEAWLVGRHTYDAEVGRPGWSATRRKRRPDEYPENQVAELRELVRYTNAIIVRLGEVQSIARRRIEELERWPNS